MSRYKVSPTDLTELNYYDEDSVEAILQNVAIILATKQGDVPMKRDFGMPSEMIDAPLPVAETILIAQCKECVEKYESRVTVMGVSVSRDESNPSVLIPTVEVEINGS